MNTNIPKSLGGTPSERYLAQLGEGSFLNLWSYPNVFIDKKKNGKGDGKELCDLLVVCGEHILVFSDKTIACPVRGDMNLAWTRWYRSSIQDSVKQVNGAIRWIKQFPNKVFLDRACTIPFPISFPSLGEAKFHGIVVALGCIEASKKCHGGNGSLIIQPSLKGDDHMNPANEGFIPFAIGDVNPGKDFVHVLNEVTLDIIMSELDTISDMTNYLDSKAKFIRSGFLSLAYGEEDLLAYYLQNFSEDGYKRDFYNLEGKPWKQDESLLIQKGMYESLYKHPSFLAKKEADKISYLWDGLITNFTSNMLKGEMAEVEEQPYEFKESEKVLKHMAFENRFLRRAHSIGIDEIIRQYKKGIFRLVRGLLPTAEDRNSKTGYVYLMLAYPEPLDFSKDYESHTGSIAESC